MTTRRGGYIIGGTLTTMTHTRNVLRNRLHELSDQEHVVLERAITQTRVLTAGQIVVRHGEPVHCSMLLVDGFMTRHIDARDGRRHLMAIHVPGDVLDLHAYPLGSLDHDVGALSEVTVAVVPHAALDDIQVHHPALAKHLWFATMIDAAMHRQWTFRLSNLSALERVAHFLCEMHARLLAIGACEGQRFALPMTQGDVSEVCGLTNVHVSRVMRQLRESELCSMRSHWVDIHDLRRLADVGQFKSEYLYVNPPLSVAAVGGQLETS